MKKMIILIITSLVAFTLLIGCNKNIRPKKITETEFSKSEAQIIMKRTWQPIYEMKHENTETRPKINILSREEFYEIYDFSFMGEIMISTLYQSIVNTVYDEETKTDKDPKDNNGYIIFNENKYIPTIYDEGVYIKQTYVRDSKYSEKHSDMDIIELIVQEASNDKVNESTSDFHRTNIFRKNENDQWILYSIEGVISIGWGSK